MADEKDRSQAAIARALARHRVSIWGMVTDGVNGRPIAGAEVTLTTMPVEFDSTLKGWAQFKGEEWAKRVPRPDKTRSRIDGLFYFLDLPDGKYEVRALLPNCGKRYGEARQDMRVSRLELSRGGLESLKRMWVGLVLRPTAIKGRVTDAAKKAGVMMAELRLKGSGERAFSDARGEFTLAPIEASEKAERTLQAFAQGYKRQEKGRIVVAKAGQLVELEDMELEPARRE